MCIRDRAKSIKPLPIVKYKDGVAYDSFEDAELCYRQRYVDLIVNEGVKETFQMCIRDSHCSGN